MNRFQHLNPSFQLKVKPNQTLSLNKLLMSLMKRKPELRSLMSLLTKLRMMIKAVLIINLMKVKIKITFQSLLFFVAALPQAKNPKAMYNPIKYGRKKKNNLSASAFANEIESLNLPMYKALGENYYIIVFLIMSQDLH